MKALRIAGLVFFSCCLMVGCFIFVIRIQLNLTVLNEGKHIKLQQEFNIYEGIQKEVDIRIQRALSEANIYSKPEESFITVQEIEEMILEQTRDYIEILKGTSNKYTKVNTGYYVNKLKASLTNEGYPLDYLNNQYNLYITVENILNQYLQVVNDHNFTLDPSVITAKSMIAFIYSHPGYWLSLIIGGGLGLIVLWQYKWRTIVIHSVCSSFGLGFTVSTLFLYLYKISSNVYEINLGQKQTYIFAKTYNALFYDLFIFGGGLVLNILILLGTIFMLKEGKALILKS